MPMEPEYTIIFLKFFFFFLPKKAPHCFIFSANMNINYFHILQP